MSSMSLPRQYPVYWAFGEQGEFERKARTIGELPLALVRPAIETAKREFGLPVIHFGVPVYQSLGMTKAECFADSRAFLEQKGADLALSLFWPERH